MHNTNDWKFFFDEFNVFSNSLRLRVLIESIIDVADKNKPLLELGSGSGATARILADMGYMVTATDIDSDVVRKIREKLFYPDSLLKVECLDMLNITYKAKSIGVVFHQGLLEHFQDDMIVKTLEEQARVADWVVFDVPNNRDNERHYGDERFLRFSQWKYLIEKSGLDIIYYKGRMPPRWTYIFPHALFTNKSGLFSLVQKLFGRSYIFVCKSKTT